MHRFLDLDVFEVLLTHNRYTLVDRSADELITRAADAGLGVVNAAYLGGGMLANPHGAPTTATARPRRPPRPPPSRSTPCAESGEPTWPPRPCTSPFAIPGFRCLWSASARANGWTPSQSLAVNLPDEFWAAAETLLPDPSNWLEPPT